RPAGARCFTLRARSRRSRFGLLLLLLLLLQLFGWRFRSRRMLGHEEILPGEQDADGQQNGQEEIAIILVHVAFSSRAASVPLEGECGQSVLGAQRCFTGEGSCTLASARSRSLINSVKRRCTVPERAIKT